VYCMMCLQCFYSRWKVVRQIQQDLVVVRLQVFHYLSVHSIMSYYIHHCTLSIVLLGLLSSGCFWRFRHICPWCWQVIQRQCIQWICRDNCRYAFHDVVAFFPLFCRMVWLYLLAAFSLLVSRNVCLYQMWCITLTVMVNFEQLMISCHC